jgi:protein-disulfide isomerase
MGQQRLFKSLDFNTAEEYFDYIIASIENGQPKQVKELYAKLNKENKMQFLHYLDTCYHYDKEENENPVLEFLRIIH